VTVAPRDLLSILFSMGQYCADNRPATRLHISVQCFDASKASAPDYKLLPYLLFPAPSLLICVTATAIYPTEGGPRTHGYGLMSSPPASPTGTLVNTVHPNERPSSKLKIPCGKSNILNSVVVDAAGQSLYTISSNSKRTTFVACQNNVEIATVQWDRSSPRMVFRGKKIKCKEWLPPAGPGTEYKPLSSYCLLSF